MIKQGELLKSIYNISDYIINDDSVEIIKDIYPYVFVINQNCDLIQTFNLNIPAHSRLHNIIVCPAYPVQYFDKKIHTLGMERNLDIIKKYSSIERHGKKIDKIKDKFDPRYHYIESRFLSPIPYDLIVDFKHFFTIGYDNLAKQLDDNSKICVLKDLYKEDLTIRFSNYVSRIALP